MTAREIRLCLENRKRHGRRWKRLNRGFLNERERERGHRSFSLSSSGSNNSKTAVGLSGSRGAAYYSTITVARVGQDVQSGWALHPPLAGFKCRPHCLLLNYERGRWCLPYVCVQIVWKFSGVVRKFIRSTLDRLKFSLRLRELKIKFQDFQVEFWQWNYNASLLRFDSWLSFVNIIASGGDILWGIFEKLIYCCFKYRILLILISSINREILMFPNVILRNSQRNEINLPARKRFNFKVL